MRAALITGASRGIGRAIALGLAGSGWDIGVNYLSRRDAAASVAAEISALGRKAALCPGDVGLAAGREAALRAFRDAFGRIDALVNNAGVSSPSRADILNSREESFDAVIAANLKGPFFLCRDVARWMLEIREADPDRPLHILNLSSISEYAASVLRSEYCLAKAGLGMLTRLYALRLAAHGIQVNEIRPGIIATDMTAPVKEKYDRLIAEGLTPIRRWGAPEDVARAAAALLNGDFPFTTGAAFDIDGGFHIRAL